MRWLFPCDFAEVAAQNEWLPPGISWHPRPSEIHPPALRPFPLPFSLPFPAVVVPLFPLTCSLFPGGHGVIPALYVVRNPMNRATSVMSRAVNRMVCASTRSTPGR